MSNSKIKKLINFYNNEKVDVSILVPICNVEKYLEKCLESLINQTMKDIEIICIDDGSTDRSSEIIDEYAKKDRRVKAIHKENSGYGDSMNLGLEHAKGKYIGILESDDFAELDMFERLYSIATIHNADIVKSNFYFYWANGENNDGVEQNTLFKIIEEYEDRKVIEPVNYENGKMFKAKASIWSAIYKSSFLKENRIIFLDTPGASFQDTSFTFKAFSAAKRMVLVEDAYVHYRQDNEGSSVNNLDKKRTFVFKEYDEIFSNLGIDRFYEFDTGSAERHKFDIAVAAFYDACIWMYEGLSIENRYEYLLEVSDKLKILLDAIPVNEIEFGDCFWKYRDIKRITKNQFEYHIWRECERYKQINKINLPLNYKEKRKRDNTKRNKVDFSIIVPVYNSEAYLTACLESIRNQKYKNFEVICVDDGSTDDSIKILEYFNYIDSRFRYCSIKNSGPSTARNKGLDIASGKYILFVDSDDFYSSNALELLSKEIENTKSDVITNYVFSANIYPNHMSNEWLEKHLQCQNKIFEKFDFKIFDENPFLGVHIWKWAFNREFLKKNKITFDTDLKYGEDAVFLFKVLESSRRIVSISEQIYNYRISNEESLMHGIEYTDRYAKTQLNILEKILEVLYSKEEKNSHYLFEFCADFMYGAINRNHDIEVISGFVDLMKKYSINEYVAISSNNAKGFYEWCVKYIEMENNKNSNLQNESVELQNESVEVQNVNSMVKTNIFIKLIRKIIPISRQAYYDYESKKIRLIEEQTREIIEIKNELCEIKKNSRV